MTDQTYQTEVHILQGGKTMGIMSGGNIVMDSGAYFSATGDFYLQSGANLIIQSNATLTLQSGAIVSALFSTVFDVYSDASLNVHSGGTFSMGNSAIGTMYSNTKWAVYSNAVMQFDSGATLSFGESAILQMKSIAKLDIYSGAIINLLSGAVLSIGESAAINLYSNAAGNVYSGVTWAVYSGATLSIGNSAIVNIFSNAVVNINSNATVSLDNSAHWYIASAADFYYGALSVLTGIQIGALLLNQGKTLRVMESQGVGSGVLSVVSIPAHTRYVFVSASGAMSNGSLQLYSCLLGEKLRIQLAGAPAQASVSFCLAASGLHGANGVSLVGMSNGTVLSALAIDGSAQTGLWVELAGIADGTWAVVGKSDLTFVVERAN
jgi:hypothetical protein